jgi:hypothetical protein
VEVNGSGKHQPITILQHLQPSIIYCKQTPSEMTIYFQSVYYNNNVSSNQESIYMKSQLMRTEWGVEREGGREREERINRAGDRVLDKMEMAWVRNGR